MTVATKLYDGMNKSTDIHDTRNYTPQKNINPEVLPQIAPQDLEENALPKDKVKELTKDIIAVKNVKLPKIGIRAVTHQGTKPSLQKSSIPGQLKQAINFVYYESNLPVLLKMDPNGKILVPTENTNLDNPGGIQNLMERCIVPPHADVSIAFKTKNNVPLLNPVKPKLFDQEFKKEKIWEFQPHIYDTAVRLVSSRIPKRGLTAIETAAIQSPSVESLFESINEPAPLADYNDNFRPVPGKKAPGWVIVIENGKVDDTTGAYEKFHSKIRELDIKSISFWIIESIAAMGIKFSIPNIILDCETVIRQSKDPIIYPLPYEVILDCIYNKKTVTRLLRRPGQIFLNSDIGSGLAASLIQSVYRHYRTRVQRQEMLELHRATKVFKHYWSLYKMRKRFYGVYRAKLEEAYENFRIIQDTFVSSNEELHAKLRILVVIVPKNYKKPNEFMDIERLFPMVYDQNMRMIVVLPFKHERFDEKLKDYFDTLHFPSPMETGRLHVIVPENAKHFQDRSLTETSLYLSQFALEKIKEICQKRNPVVIADEFSIYIAGICAYLNCPYFGPSVKAEDQLRDNKCIISKWINESGTNIVATQKYWVARVKEPKELQDQVREIARGRPDKLLWKFTRANNFGGLMDFFPIIFTTKDIHENVLSVHCDEDIVMTIWGSGGVLEILPIENRDMFNVVEVGFYVQPEGNCKLVASSETIMMDEKPFGTYIPQQAIPQQKLLEMMCTISAICKSNGIFGYVSFECLSKEKSFRDIYISRIVPRLTYNVFRAVTVAVKSRLIHDQSSLEMKTNYSDLHWKPPYISKSAYADKRVGQVIATELWEIKKQCEAYQEVPPVPNFAYSMKKLKYLLEPYMNNFYPEPKSLHVSENKEEEPHNQISSTAIRLLTEEIPSIVAYQNDHSLRKAVPLTKQNKRNSLTKNSQAQAAQKQLEQKIAHDKAVVLLEEVELLMDSDDPEKLKILSSIPWHKLKKIPE
ncbi:hypothetical protein HDV06_004248 [Boothiomyces sp. JEL0866]|nr:hypothetical protein HDV06_004248 [Boothiomyces sp. JEL0866]